MTETIARVPVNTVSCPHCGSTAGDPCVTNGIPTPEALDGYHQRREDVAHGYQIGYVMGIADGHLEGQQAIAEKVKAVLP